METLYSSRIAVDRREPRTHFLAGGEGDAE
jgi:hypothetical protein